MDAWLLWFAPLLWAVYVPALAICFWEAREKRKLPYRQANLAAMSDTAWAKKQERDSRGLRRVMGIMDRGTALIHLEEGFWENLDRRLGLMGEKDTGRERLAKAMLRSVFYAMPALALPLLLGGWWKLVFYPVAVAVLSQQEYLGLERAYARWQKELVRDIPQVMDRLRICFAGGRDYLSALRQARDCGGPAMHQALSRLLEDIQSQGSSAAFRLFSLSFDLPSVQKLASALMLAVESGYGAAETYFNSIEGELVALRQEAAEALIQAKPEKIYRLYALMFALSVGALGLKGWEILQQVGKLFM